MSEQHSKHVRDLIKIFIANKNHATASSMKAYMRHQFEFLGIPSPKRSDLQREFVSTACQAEDPIVYAEELWRLPFREYQYTACDLLVKVARTAKFLKRVEVSDRTVRRLEHLIITKSWWDTVDAIVPRILFAVINQLPKGQLQKYANSLIEQENFWLQRSALILQLGAKGNTDFELLSALILRRANSKEFFVQKASGWALREYSKVNPRAVRKFINAYKEQLSRVTLREAEKYC